MKVATLNDIKEFLSHLGFNWTGKIYDEASAKTRTATLADFNGKSPISFFVETKGGIKEIKFKVNDIVFEQHAKEENMWSENTMEEDYSEEWQDFLINKHGAVYGKLLFDWNNQMCQYIIADSRKKMEKLDEEKARIKEIADVTMAPFERKQRELIRKFPDTLDEHII